MSQMLDEIYEQPEAIARVADRELGPARALAADLRKKGIRHVFIAARGTSDNAATYAKYLFEIVAGVPTTQAAPSVFTLYHAKVDLRGSLVIGISQSGQATDVVQTIANARESGALTACITNVADSPLTKVSDHVFLCQAGEEKAVAATKSYTTTLALLALIAGAWAETESLIEGVKRIPEKLVQTLSLNADVETLVERYRYMEDCAVLARGLNQATALEAALKITETSYLVAKPYSGAEFQHGPIAMVSEGFPCLMFAPDGFAYASLQELAPKLRDRGAELLVVARNPEILKMGVRSLSIPVLIEETLSPILYILPAQMFAYHLAKAKGKDPDKPRGLSKVTLTR